MLIYSLALRTIILASGPWLMTYLSCMYVPSFINFTFRFHFICLPIAHPRFKREYIKPVCLRSRPFTRSDLLLPSQGMCDVYGMNIFYITNMMCILFCIYRSCSRFLKSGCNSVVGATILNNIVQPESACNHV